MLPKVTIAIPTHNRAATYLTEAVESALSQDYPNIEILIVDDGSTDNTREVLTPYIEGNQIRYVKRENGGCAAAKNTALEHATGDFITNLDDDDRYHPTKVRQQVEMFMQRPSMGICGTGVRFIDAQGKVIEHYMPPQFFPKTQTLQLLRRCFLIQSSVMIHRKVHQHLGNYADMLSEDYQFWLRVSLHYEIGIVEDFLTDYRIHGDQITGPETRPELMEAVEQLVRDFATTTPIRQIIPGLCDEIYAYILIGLLLCEQGLNDLSRSYFKRVPPSPASYLGLGLLQLKENRFDKAKAYFAQVEGEPFAALAGEGLLLTERVETALQQLVRAKMERAAILNHPAIDQLRGEISQLHAFVIQRLLRLAKGRH